jgi:hypothetical protein
LQLAFGAPQGEQPCEATFSPPSAPSRLQSPAPNSLRRPNAITASPPGRLRPRQSNCEMRTRHGPCHWLSLTSTVIQADGRPLLGTETNCGRRSIGFAEGGRRAKGFAGACRSRLRQPVVNHIDVPCGRGIRPKQVRKAMTTHKARSDLLEVWLGFLEKIEGPKRRRAQELRRRRDNPKRRASNRGSHLRAFGMR